MMNPKAVKSLLLFLIVIPFGLQAQIDPPKDKDYQYQLIDGRPMKGQTETIVCRSVYRGTYSLADGEKRKGKLVDLHFSKKDTVITLGKGNHFTWEGEEFVVTRVRRSNWFNRYKHGNLYISPAKKE